MAERISNTFEGGLQSDKDPRLSNSNTYRQGINGRIIYNESGTLAWENINGNVQAVSNFSSLATIIGVAEFTDFVIVFSQYILQGGATIIDEIGYIRFDEYGNGVYSKLYNDNNDVNGLKMNFQRTHPLQCVPFYESDTFIRVYWTDDYNEPRVYTFSKKYDAQGEWYLETVTNSEFTMNITPDFKMGEIRYQGITKGSLRSGIYQYCYRLKTNDGYQTPWTPITFPIPLTGRDPEKVSSNKYGFADVDVIGVTGNALSIANVDVRYKDIEIAYVYAITESAVKEAGIFSQQEIDGRSTIEIRHSSIENIIPIDVSELIDLKDVILKAKTIQIHDNRLWLGNVEGKQTFNIPEECLANAWCEPEFRATIMDTISHVTPNLPNFEPIRAAKSGGGSYQRRYRRYVGGNTYSTKTLKFATELVDFVNYQGSQMCHSWKGYFRGEVYRFAVVFYDKKGYPFFAKHLGDVQMPSHTRGIGQGASKGVRNNLYNKRVKDDGNISYKEVEVGNMGGIPTEVNYTYNGSAQFVNPDRKLEGKDATVLRSGTDTIEDDYSLSHNSPVDNLGNFKPTRLIWNVPNNIGTASERNTASYDDKYKYTYSRLLGLRFGGINLNVVVDDKGTLLKDIIGGVQIVRAERKGANEQVKEQGVLLPNLAKSDDSLKHNQGTDTQERPKLWAHSSPILSGLSNPNGSSGGTLLSRHKYRDDGGGDATLGRAERYHYQLHGVNGIVADDWYSAKQGITVLRKDYIVNPTNIDYPLSEEDAGYNIVNRNNQGSRQRYAYVSKLLDCYNTNALYKFNDIYPSTGRWIDDLFKECNIGFRVDELVSNTNPRSNYGFIGSFMIGTECWLANANNDDEQYTHLDMYTSPSYDGTGGITANLSDKHFYRGVMTSAYFLKAAVPYASPFGQINHSVFGEQAPHNYHSAYIVSLVEPNKEPYGGLRNEAIQNTRFHTTGHFLTVDDQVLSDIENNGEYVLDELEVWGGDCHLDAFVFARVMPIIEYDPEGNCIPQPLGKEVNADQSGDSRLDLSNPGEYRDWSHGMIVPIESKYNFKLTLKDDNNGVPTYEEVGMANAVGFVGDTKKKYYKAGTNNGIFERSDDICPEKNENFQLQAALAYFDRVRSFATKPVDFIDITDHPTRWSWSNLKQPLNQRIDRFREFEELSNNDLDGTYGEITGNALFNDNIYCFQEKSFGRLRVNERAIAGSDIGDIKLGEGGTMDGIEIISHEYGTQHRDSVTTSNRSIYWIDAKMKKIFRFGGDGMTPISDAKGLHTVSDTLFNAIQEKENIINGYGIVSSFDFGNNDVYFTIKNALTGNYNALKDIQNFDNNGYQTILYNEDLQLFQGNITAYPTVYFRNGANIYSPTNLGTGRIWRYNSGNKGLFFNELYHSYLEFNINHQSRMAKKYDTSLWNINEEALSNIRTVTFKAENRIHEYVNLSNEIVNINGYLAGGNRARYREGTLRFPIREQNSGKPRLTGKVAQMTIWYENIDNKKISLTNIDTIIRYTHRK
jgi:hypothetical protein